MPDYQLGKIYKVVNSENEIVYYGSTAQKLLCVRMGGHKRLCAIPTKTSKWVTALRTIGADKFTIVLIHAFPCNSKAELEAEEYRVLDAAIAAGTEVYNSMIAGKACPETLAKLAIVNRRAHTDETKLKLSKIHTKFGSLRYRDLNACWTFSWQVNKKTVMKSFSAKKYGYWQAFLMAEACRKTIFPEWKTSEEETINEFGAINI